MSKSLVSYQEEKHALEVAIFSRKSEEHEVTINALKEEKVELDDKVVHQQIAVEELQQQFEQQLVKLMDFYIEEKMKLDLERIKFLTLERSKHEELDCYAFVVDYIDALKVE